MTKGYGRNVWVSIIQSDVTNLYADDSTVIDLLKNKHPPEILE